MKQVKIHLRMCVHYVHVHGHECVFMSVCISVHLSVYVLYVCMSACECASTDELWGCLHVHLCTKGEYQMFSSTALHLVLWDIVSHPC